MPARYREGSFGIMCVVTASKIGPIAQANIAERTVDSWATLRSFWRADALAADLKSVPTRLASPTYRFQWLLRLAEFADLAGRSPLGRIGAAVLRRVNLGQGIRLGFTVPLHTTGPGLCLAHWGTVVIHPQARLGANCRVHVGVVIGMAEGRTPIVGDNVYIGPGVKVFGAVHVGDGSVLGANSVVTADVAAGSLAIGAPARRVREAERWP